MFFTADDGQHGRELWAMAAMPTVLPLTISLAGVSLFAQGAVLDPAAAFATMLAMTGGLQAIVGP